MPGVGVAGIVPVALMPIGAMTRRGGGLAAIAIAGLGGHAALALDGRTGGLVLGVELHMLGVFIDDRRE
ncbi:MAG: hypothetical protein WED13_03470, partial [Methyloceanibacter sp.]